MMANLLIIDDEQLMCRSLSLVAKQLKHSAVCTTTLADGLEKSREQQFDVVFLDVNMPDGNGLSYIRELAGSPSAPEVIIITGYSDPTGAEQAITSGAWDYLEKGASLKEITLSLRRALQYREQKLAGQHNLCHVDFSSDGIIGSSASLKECLKSLAQAAISDASVLITGDTGTGKELFARAVHRISARKNAKFVVVDCAALPENLIEGMLFGHEKGAFTSADQSHTGLIAQAHNGTLFLDEVGEMPLSLQKVFLRVLQECRFRPLGSKYEQESNFRLVVATNRDLDNMVQEGLFRSDLLYRLSQFVIRLPGLAERAEDIPLLARHHADLICTRYGISHKDFSPDFIRMFNQYRWPGNVRELVNALERSIVSARSEKLLFPKHLPLNIRIEVTQQIIRKEPPVSALTSTLSSLPKLQEYRESASLQAESQYLQNLMQLTDGSIPESCQISGLSTSRLYALLKKHNIPSRR
jgi:two-component system NtrC family response regulator